MRRPKSPMPTNRCLAERRRKDWKPSKGQRPREAMCAIQGCDREWVVIREMSEGSPLTIALCAQHELEMKKAEER